MIFHLIKNDLKWAYFIINNKIYVINIVMTEIKVKESGQKLVKSKGIWKKGRKVKKLQINEPIYAYK